MVTADAVAVNAKAATQLLAYAITHGGQVQVGADRRPIEA